MPEPRGRNHAISIQERNALRQRLQQLGISSADVNRMVREGATLREIEDELIIFTRNLPKANR